MRITILLVLALPMAMRSQPLTPTVITPLDTLLNETSELLEVDGSWWTILDSGNPHALYSIDPATGDILRTVTVTNAVNTDWEALASDADWLYIGDVGNNSGARTDLRVYRVPLSSVLDPDITSMEADTIRFAYALQSDFTPAYNNTDWDCEAMVAADDSLFLFSKNRVTGTCYLYALPATPGDHLAERRDTLDAQGLITGASIDTAHGAIALVGYSNGVYLPFIWRLADYSGHDFFQGTAQRHDLAIGITQMEGIAWNGPFQLYMTSEQNSPDVARLWELELDSTIGIIPPPSQALGPVPAPLLVHPNPANDRVSLSSLFGVGRWQVTDTQGRVLLDGSTTTTAQAIDLSSLAPGVYLLIVTDAMGQRVVRVVKR